MNMTLSRSIRQILLACSTAAFAASAVAVVGVQHTPPGPGMVPDYFGVTPNYATSPRPILTKVTVTDPGTNGTNGGTGAVLAATTYDYNADAYTTGIKDVQIVTGGTGYSENTVVTVSGGTGVTPVTVTPEITNGVITGIAEFNPIDLTGRYIGADAVVGSGFIVPLAGTGIHKFVDALPGIPGVSSYTNGPDYTAGLNQLGQGMPAAVADTTTFPGSDYYVIGVQEYTRKLHADLPATHLRGYVQLDPVTGVALGPVQYLGPIIVAQKDRAVRIKLINQLSKTTDATGLKGNLTIPVDTTYMGAEDTQNRAALHMHGGNTPWISDGTVRQWVKPKGETSGKNKGESARDVPDMWFDASGNLLANSATCTQGTTTCTTPGATNNPGDGALTFYYTNQQSARLMFYHDHTEGTTRLNVYGGAAAGYLLQDDTEKAMIEGGTVNGATFTAGTLPSLADTIPLVIQEKTFVPNNSEPVLNFYGPFKSQLNSQDPTWRWGSGNADSAMGTGDLWLPHVFMPNQNPGDVTGANNVGRWDYGPWFWPPFTGIQHSAVDNPYYDDTCQAPDYCEGPFIPGVPNGNTLTDAQLATQLSDSLNTQIRSTDQRVKALRSLSAPSGTPEAFNDTPLVNGTAYPYITVDPKKYRLRLLSVGNDRMFNLSLVVAASKNSLNTTAAGNAGSVNSSILCDGTTAVNQADCTEVKMVPFNNIQDQAKPFPGHWYTAQKGGVTFDGRPSGVFDPTTRGPAMVQIGTDGGFLSSPTTILNQPVNFEYNPKNIVIGSIKEHALLLGPAERAEVLVDFSNFAGSTLILYNDSPAPVPAFDLRMDYYTGNFDTTDTGGTFSTLAGFGPNTRTLMQIRVTGSGGTNPVDDTGTIDMAKLTTAVQTAFRTSQEPIIVPQAAYNPVYGSAVADLLGSSFSRISDNVLSFMSLSDPITGTSGTSVILDMQPKAIIEDWTRDYGRMNAMLGLEVPRTSAMTQTSIPQAFIDPPTELVKISPNDGSPISGVMADGTQLWTITHNGVDSHAIHFHLFHVQLIDRVGWDGAIVPPEANELGWKDTVLMHPLQDTIVALRPMNMTLPFKVGNSHRKLDPSGAATTNPMMFFNLDPFTGNGSSVTNSVDINYGWEYLWHCHILGHEENDMMRSIAVAQTPETPSALTVTKGATANQVILNWVDNSMVSNWFTIQRSSNASFSSGNTTFNVVLPECAAQAGCNRTYIDTLPSRTGAAYYRVMAQNTVGAGDGRQDLPRNPIDGSYGDLLSNTLAPADLAKLMPSFIGYANVTASSAYSGTASATAIATVTSATPMNFGTLASGTTKAMAVTITNNGVLPLSFPNAASISGTGYTLSATGTTCTTGNSGIQVASGASCNLSVTASSAARLGTLSIPTNDPFHNPLVVSMTSTSIVPIVNLPASLDFGSALKGSTSAGQTLTLANTGTAPLTLSAITVPAQFALGTGSTCGTGATKTVAGGASCTINLVFKPTTVGAVSGNLSITDNNNGVTSSVQTVSLTGTGIATSLPVINGVLSATPPATVSLSWTRSSSVAGQPDSFQLKRGVAATNGNCPATLTNLGAATTLLTATDATVAAGTTYCYQVVATAAKVVTNSTVFSVAIPVAPQPPTLLTYNFTDASTLTLGWTPGVVIAGNPIAPAANGLLLQQCTGTTATGTCAAAGAGWATVANLPANATSYTVANLTAGTSYLFRVATYNPAQSAWLTSAALKYAAPAAPTLPVISSVSDSGMTFGWTASVVSATAGAPTGYTVQQCQALTVCNAATGAWTNVGTVNAATTSYSVTGLTAGTPYWFRVQANNLLTSAWVPTTTASWTVPAVPGTPTTASVAATTLTLNWTAPATGSVQTYTVQRSLDSTFATGVTSTTGLTTTSLAVTGLTANTTYYFRVVAVTPSGNVNSASVTQTTLAMPVAPTAPTAPTTASVTATTLALNWSAAADATTYTVQRATNAGFTTGLTSVATGVTGTSYAVTGLTANTTYYFRVNAVNAAGTTNGAASAAQLTAPATPGTITAVRGASGSRAATLTWTAPAGTGTITAKTLQMSVNNGAFINAGGTFRSVTATNAAGTGATITGLTVGATYSFRLAVTNATATSAYSTGSAAIVAR